MSDSAQCLVEWLRDDIAGQPFFFLFAAVSSDSYLCVCVCVCVCVCNRVERARDVC